MYEAQQQRMRRLGRNGDLDEQQQQRLLAEFLLRSVKHSKLMVGQLLDRPPPPHQKRFFRGSRESSITTADGDEVAAASAAAAGGVQAAAAACDCPGAPQTAEQALQTGTQESLQQQQQAQDTAASAA
eukprot:GHRQ01032371.1.p2 GENE.GHRQ01032371.1~~GHRQ01032371.1.p2  ORF type:complete len:128 (+),score=74.70 GHRQ01032371.1:1-384(+)